MTNQRAIAFRKLQPVCVATSQTTLRYKAKNATGRDVVHALEKLFNILDEVDNLDSKLADYVFFPLSLIFQDRRSLPSRALQISLRCLQKLISHGWRTTIGVDLCKQLLVLLSFLTVDEAAGSKGQNYDEEIYEATLSCLSCLFQQAGGAVSSFSESLSTESLPVIGHVVSVMLRAMLESHSTEIQLAAINAIRAFIHHFTDLETLRNFLPGIVSNITKSVQPRTGYRRPYKVLVDGLLALSDLFRKVMAKDTLSDASREKREGNTLTATEGSEAVDIRINAESEQIKLAVANIVILRYHEKNEVLQALFQLCVTILRDCCNTLRKCATLALETSIFICSQGNPGSQAIHWVTFNNLVALDSNLSDTLKSSTYDWIMALPRVIQSSDALKRERHLRFVTTAYQACTSLLSDTDMLDNALASSVRESVVAAICDSKPLSIQSVRTCDSGVLIPPWAESTSSHAVMFENIPLPGKLDHEILQELERLITDIANPHLVSKLKHYLIDNLARTSGQEHLASLWLSIFLSKPTPKQDFDELLEVQERREDIDDTLADVTYACSLRILSKANNEDGNDWRLQATALEAIANQSNYQKFGFRAELVDALYPVVERMGSSNALLRAHALLCLDLVAQSCGYQTSGKLISQNVDYLINSLALKFNTFDISPQAPNVLVMMIRLCGDTLIPYLDDLIESVYSALATYHGYPRLVESLFLVLSAVVNEGSKSAPPLTQKRMASGESPYKPPIQVLGLKNFFAQRGSLQNVEDDLDDPAAFDADQSSEAQQEHSSCEDRAADAVENLRAVPSKTYTTIQSIVRLGQHYLTHESASLRQQLLKLMSKGCSTLQGNEDEFLPLVNDIWPVVVKRLYDVEASVAIAATEALSMIFHCAGDFVSSRVSNEWENIQRLYKRTQTKMTAENKGKGGRGTFTSTYRLWDALVEMMLDMIRYTRIDADVEDDLMNMLALHASTRLDVYERLDSMNADALWLSLELRKQYLQGRKMPEAPILEGVSFKQLKRLQ